MIQMLSWEEAEPLLKNDFDSLGYIGFEEMYTFVENGEIIGTALLFFDETQKEVYIANFDTAKERVGYGRKMINFLSTMDNVDKITGEAAKFVAGFFKKMGAVFGEYDKCMEGYKFVIYCSKK